MEAFNIIAGVVTIAALFFSLWVFMSDRRARALEQQKSVLVQHRLADALALANAIGGQCSLIASLSDRDDVTKKELKHLVVSMSTTIMSLQSALARMDATERAWRFNTVAAYLPTALDGPDVEPVGQR